MRLVDLVQGDKVKLEVLMMGSNYEFPSTVISKKSNYIFTQVVRVDGKVLGFGGENITVNLVFDRPNQSPLIWRGIGCNIISNKGTTQYKIIATGEGFELNRRCSYRISVGISGIAQIGANRKAEHVIVKDVSDTGFSFIFKEDIEGAEGNAVRLVFADIGIKLGLVGIVTRKVVLGEGKVLYGCKLNLRNQLLSRYIMEKQRQLILNIKNKNQQISEQSIEGLSRGQDVEKVQEPKLPRSRTVDSMNSMDKNLRRKIFQDSKSGKKKY